MKRYNNRRKLFCLTLFLGLPCLLTQNSLSAQQLSWPKVTKETKPWTRWWWEGNAVRTVDLDTLMAKYSAANLGGVEITPIYGVHGYEDRFADYLSPKWMDLFQYTLQRAKEEGLGVDLANASGWPFGGPWVNQEDACKTMATKSYHLQGGKQLFERIEYIEEGLVRLAGHTPVALDQIKNPINTNKNLQEMALDQVRFRQKLPLVILTANDLKGHTINLTDKVTADGRLKWKAPKGDWTLCAVFEGLHGKLVERAGPGGEGDVIDHFSPTAIDNYLHHFDEAFKGKDISNLRYFFNDSYEVDDARGEADWTPHLFDEFKQRRGYDLRNYLPALLQLDTPENNARVLYDYRMTINDLLVDVYTKRWQQWAAKQGKGIRNQGHGSPANILDIYAASDVPEIEGRDLVSIKSAPSAAHTQGKRLVSSESATWLNEHFQSNLGDVKQALDLFFLGGVNHIFYHGTCFSPNDAPWPGWLFYAAVHFNPNNPFWEDFAHLNEYVTRVQSFMQSGKPDNDLLLYYNIADLMSAHNPKGMLQHFSGLDRSMANSTIRKSAVSLTEKGYAWDMISDKQLWQTSCDEGFIITPGARYKAVLVPDSYTLPLETLKQLVELAQKGATVLLNHFHAYKMAGMNLPATRQNQFNALLKQLALTENSELQTTVCGKGRIVACDDINALMSAAQIEPEAMYGVGLQCIRRTQNKDKAYFIANRTENTFSGTVLLNTNAQSAAIFNPMNGKAGVIATQSVGKKTQVGLQLYPGESLILTTSPQQVAGECYHFYQDATSPIMLNQGWSLQFVSGGPTLPAFKELAEPQDWTQLEGDAYKDFSGSAIYSTHIAAIPNAEVIKLDLGALAENASVFLNDEYIGTVLQKPYQLFIPTSRFKGNDKLEVKVANSMANRMAYVGRKGIDWQIFYNINISPRLRENNNNGKLDTSHWKAKPSGLFGPVTLVGQRKVLFNK